MHIKRFFLSSLFLLMGVMVIVGLASSTPSLKMDLFGLSMTLPVAIWMVLPAFVVVVAAIGHMMFYSAVRYYNDKAEQKEIEALGEMFKAVKEGRDFHYPFTNRAICEVAQMILPSDGEKSGIHEQEALCENGDACGEWGRKAGQFVRKWTR